jgi:coproporphyrinogen III oxidase-like Fe-S oxidoreductase
MEGYFEQVVERLTSAGYRWYETANFCRPGSPDSAPDYRSRHNLAYWHARDYVGLGIGAVSTVDGHRWRNAPSLVRYVGALGRGLRPPREHEPLDNGVRQRERVMLGLRLDEPLAVAGLDEAIDGNALERLERLGLARTGEAAGGRTLALTHRGRFLGGGVTAELLA